MEITPDGDQIKKALLDNTGNPPGAGALFGLIVRGRNSGIYYVDDASNTLNLFSAALRFVGLYNAPILSPCDGWVVFFARAHTRTAPDPLLPMLRNTNYRSRNALVCP